MDGVTDDRSVAPTDLPEFVVVGKNGAYWRDYGTHYSMCPVSEDNDPVEPVAVYVNASKLADCEDALTTVERAYERDAGLPSIEAITEAMGDMGAAVIGRGSSEAYRRAAATALHEALGRTRVTPPVGRVDGEPCRFIDLEQPKPYCAVHGGWWVYGYCDRARLSNTGSDSDGR